MIKILFCCLGLCFIFSCSTECKDEKCAKPASDLAKPGEGVIAQNSETEISCKLTSEELQKRKQTVLASLKKQILEKKELSDGYAFRFAGTDSVADELVEFVKSERSCCNFFVFTLSFSGDGKEAWLSLTGPKDAKEMISDELGL
jgi:hypothetical protein